MKKIILLCLYINSAFAWDLDFLKPNFNTISQSWNLSATHQTMIVAASAISLAGIIYASCITSEQSAHKQANDKLDEYKGILESKSALNIVPAVIKNYFDLKGNLVIFPFGSFWHPNEFSVTVNLGHTIIEGQTKTDIFIDLSQKRPSETTRYVYDTANKKWLEPLIFKQSSKAWYQRFFNLFLK